MGRNQKEKQEENLGFQKNLVLYFHDLVYTMLTILLTFLLLLRVIVVTQSSMYPTLWDGDYLLLLGSVFYHEPEQGDIVVLSKKSFEDGKPIVKRVIATEGQSVDIDFEQGIVYVDGKALQEDYIHNPTTDDRGTVFPLTVAPGCIFVMGDNRAVSLDSRSPSIGQVEKREVLGKAFFLMFPGTHKGQLPRDNGRIGAIE